MFRGLGPVWVIVVAILSGGMARAQMPFPNDLVPSRSALERLGLERQWFAVVPLVEAERLLKISLSEQTIYAQTSYWNLCVRWRIRPLALVESRGERSGFARGVAANKFAVFATNANILHSLDRKTGRPIWKYDLSTIPTTTPAADENRVVVGTTSGKIIGFNLKSKDSLGNEHVLTSVLPSWSWASSGAVTTRPLLADQVFVYANGAGQAYVAMTQERTRALSVPDGRDDWRRVWTTTPAHS